MFLTFPSRLEFGGGSSFMGEKFLLFYYTEIKILKKSLTTELMFSKVIFAVVLLHFACF